MASYHTMEFAGLKRALPIVAVSETINVAFLKLYGDTELTDRAADELASRLRAEIDIILAPESGGILLSHLISARSGVPYLLARKKVRPNMINPVFVEVETIGTAGVQKLYLDESDLLKLRGAKVALVDEVVSSGATIRALTRLVGLAGGSVSQTLAVATEGYDDISVTKLGHLPLFAVIP